MKNLKKEIIAIVSGMTLAYFWQLFLLLMCYVSNPQGNFITWKMFIPASGIQLAIAPMVSWMLMGLFKVTWWKKWLCITMRGVAFVIPFALIAGITIIVAPHLWRDTMYWAVNVVISTLLAFTKFKPLYIL